MYVNEIISESKENAGKQVEHFCSAALYEFHTHAKRIRDCNGQQLVSLCDERVRRARTRSKLFYRSVSMAGPAKHGESHVVLACRYR